MKPDLKKPASELRQRAEAEHKRTKSSSNLATDTPADLIEELHVHQIELEMQNEELRRSRDEINALRSKYQDLYDFAPVAYFTFDLSGTVMEANLTGAQLLGVQRETLIERSFLHFVKENSRNTFLAYCRCLATGAISETCELTLVRLPNYMLEVEMTGRKAAVDSDPQCARVACFDVSKRNQQARENERLVRVAQQARAQAEEANRWRDQFLNMVTHELRAPLTPLLGWVQLLQTKGLKTDEVDKGLEALDRNLKVQTHLIDDLLDVSRIITGNLTLHRQSVDFKSITDSVIGAQRKLADEKQIKFEYDAGRDAYPVQGDVERLRQVVFNVVGNALKFTPPQGWVKTHLSKAHGKFVLTVSDNGMGIPAEALTHIFDCFRPENFALAREFNGLGVGLYIARHLAEAHGGTIEAASPGKNLGATFVIRLPSGSV